MSVELAQGSAPQLPDVPESIRMKSPEAYQYLVDLRRNLGSLAGKLVDNDRALQNAINTGASGTFVTSGVSFVFVNGILTSTV